MIYLTRTNSENIDFQTLVILLDQDLAIRDGEEHAFFAQFNKIANLQHVIVCYIDKVPAACGAFKEYDATSVEIKRMFVLPQFRGKGIAGKVLAELEKWAKESGYVTCVLETGKKQPEAIRLYEKSGYFLIDNYGQYQGVESSVCMKKNVS